jgi:hypothetical protein
MDLLRPRVRSHENAFFLGWRGQPYQGQKPDTFHQLRTRACVLLLGNLRYDYTGLVLILICFERPISRNSLMPLSLNTAL